jgi:carbamoyltransferase
MSVESRTGRASSGSGTILGISAYYHDSAAALLRGGEVIAAAQEERFSRKKHDARFPQHAIRYCLSEAAISVTELDYVVFYDKPILKFDRLLETYLSYAPRGFRSFLTAMPQWMKEKLHLKQLLRSSLAAVEGGPARVLPPLLFSEHHQSHAASAFFPSPFERAAVLCMDGVGEWATTSVWLGNGHHLTPQWELHFPHSLGMLYAAFTAFTGFKVNSGEYKLMGLAPYGEARYVDVIRDRLLDLKEDGTFRLNMQYFNYAAGLTMTNERFARLFGGPARSPESPLSQRELDLARSIQVVTEEIVLRLARTVHRELGVKHLCLAGGVALNCVANGRLLREGPFEELWVQPAADDAGGALGAALAVWHEYLGNARTPDVRDSMKGSYLGPGAHNAEIARYLNSVGAKYLQLDEPRLLRRVAEILTEQHVVGWYHGRMEFGPRALGARSIIADARSQKMQSLLNLKIKRRESFRPFAPAVLAERASEYFELDCPSPYMLVVAPVRSPFRLHLPADEQALVGLDKLRASRSTIPVVTHVDCSARIQTVHRDTNPRFHALLSQFESLTGCPLLVNTSLNVRGEPIACTPEDAYRCFMGTDMDYLVLGDFLLAKAEQPRTEESASWTQEFEPD